MLKLLATLMVLILLGSNLAVAASGTALGVNQDAEATTAGETRILVVGADLFIGDRIVTDSQGLVQIRFSDKTELVIGPRSSLVLEDYLLRNDGSAGRLAINALAGTFRFVTGRAPKDRYLIHTPTGTIGVRGTAFDFNVDPAATSVLLFHGAVILCNLDNQCVTIDDTCELGQADTTKSAIVGSTDDIKGAARDTLRSMFPYAESQSQLLSPFRLENARRCLNRPYVAPDRQDSIGDSSPGEPPKIRGRD